MKSGKLNFLEPSGPLQVCNGTALPLPYDLNVCLCDEDSISIIKVHIPVSVLVVKFGSVVMCTTFWERNFNPHFCHFPTEMIINSYYLKQCLEKAKEIKHPKYKDIEEHLNFGPHIHNF